MKQKRVCATSILVPGIAVFLLLSSACAGSLASRSPAAVDLSGIWLLDAAASDKIVIREMPAGFEGPSFRNGNSRGTDRQDNTNSRDQGRSPAAEQRTSQAPVSFTKPAIMTAKQMTIEQDRVSMGIAYPGEVYRDVDWGQTKRSAQKVRAGWRGNVLVIRTDSEAMNYTETYTLDPTGKVLGVEIKLYGNMGKRIFTRIFIKQDDL